MDTLVSMFRESVVCSENTFSHGLDRDIEIELFVQSFQMLLPVIGMSP